jgi:IMP dehydrogenase/GMP reductase
MSNEISDRESLDYSDVFILPKYSDIASRKEVDISSDLGLYAKVPVPVISANMESVTGARMAVALREAGACGGLHRFQSIERAVEDLTINLASEKTSKLFVPTLVSVGVNRDSHERADALYDAGARYFIIDIAHGHSKHMKEMIEYIKAKANTFVIAGNVATHDGAYDLCCWGADSVKVGIGPGCFAAGTRILMGTGAYKNIEDVKAGDRVINKNGEVVSVKRSFCTGTREVVSTKTNHFHKQTVSTADHRFWMGDCRGVTDKTLASRGYKKILSKKTKKGYDKFDWVQIGKATKKTVALLPRNINFEMNEDFSIPLKKRRGGNQSTGFSYHADNVLNPSYDLGYIFGTFLGDGNSHTPTWKGSKRGSVHWSFGKSEQKIVNKLVAALKSCIQTKSSIKINKAQNMIKVDFYYKPLADFLSSFGKATKKHLPEHLLIDNENYLKGIYDGLIDSDGHVDDSRACFTNTSSELMELFGFLSYKINKHFPLSGEREKSFGNLTGCKRVSENYRSKTLKRPDYRMTDNNQIVKVLTTEKLKTLVPVYDLEVDCDTHSFIANNTIVHNSVCTTKNVTGVTVPGFQSVIKAGNGVHKFLMLKKFGPKVPIIADGGFTEIGDICKALGAGADFIMSGRFFAACDEAPNGRVYRGSASEDVQVEYRNDQQMPTPEGKSELLEGTGPVADVVENIAGGIRSAFSYVGARNMKEFHANCAFGVRKRSQR